MSYFRYKADIIPISIFVFLFLLDIYMYIIWISWFALCLYFVFSVITKWFIFPWNHHHQHVVTFSKPILNRLLEVMYGFQTGITWYGWVLHHNLGHHIHYQDQTKDESAWKSPKWKRYHPLVYMVVTTLTSPYRAYKVGNKHPKIQKYFIYMTLINTVLMMILIYIKPLQGIVIFFIPMIIEFFLTIYITYYHHSWLEDEDPYKSSYNIITPWYNLLTGNLGYHTAHHLKWSLHWSKLPDFHKTIEHKIDKKYYKTYSLLWFSHK
jgi:fatty acid desaturase